MLINRAVSYVTTWYLFTASSAPIDYTTTPWLLQKQFSTSDASCRAACDSNSISVCATYSFYLQTSSNGQITIPRCYFANANVKETAISPAKQDSKNLYDIARRLTTPVTQANYDPVGLQKQIGLASTDFYLCKSVATPANFIEVSAASTTDSTSFTTCNTLLPAKGYSRAADGSICVGNGGAATWACDSNQQALSCIASNRKVVKGVCTLCVDMAHNRKC